MKFALAFISILTVSEANAGQCSWSLTNEWAKTEISIEALKPDSKSRLMRIRGNGRRSGIASVVSESELDQLSKLLLNQSYGFEYPEEGCYMRAHLMAKKLESLGILSAKVFAWGSNWENTLMIKNEFTSKWNKWKYHVAVGVVVKTGEDQYRPMIIDPSMSPTAMTVESWIAGMLPTIKEENPPVQRVRLKVTDRFEYFPPGFPDFNQDQFFLEPKTSWDDQDTYLAFKKLNFISGLISKKRKWKWNKKMRSLSSTESEIRSLGKVIPDFIHDESDVIWVGFEGLSAYYFISKKSSNWEALYSLIKLAREKRRAVELSFDTHSLELHIK